MRSREGLAAACIAAVSASRSASLTFEACVPCLSTSNPWACPYVTASPLLQISDSGHGWHWYALQRSTSQIRVWG
eukprot:3304405-Rhodomonas_salina.1